MSRYIALLTFLFSFCSWAKEIQVAIITTDVLDEETVFYLDVNDDSTLQGVHYISTAGSGQITEDVYNSVAEVLDDGMVLKVMEGREIVRLYMDSFDAFKGGKVRLQYLTNGVTGSRNNIFLELMKKDGEFILADLQAKKIERIFVKGNWSRLLKRWIGVESIKFTTN